MNITLENDAGKTTEWFDINEYEALEAIAKFFVCVGEKFHPYIGQWIFFLLNAAQGKDDFYEITIGGWTFTIYN